MGNLLVYEFYAGEMITAKGNCHSFLNSVKTNKQTKFKCNFILDLISKWGPNEISK